MSASKSLLRAALPLAISSLLPAQTWGETGDAGNTLNTAQPVFDTPGLYCQSIIGTTQQGDVDIYAIQIDTAATFTATQTSLPIAPTNISLYLFDEQGFAITGCENISALSHVAALSGLYVPGPGRYFLAVAPNGVRPVSALGPMWVSGFFGQAKPLGIGGREPLLGWTGSSTENGSYVIAFPSPPDLSVRAVQRQVQLPGDLHLTENPNVQGSSGNASYWPIGNGRFQLLYEGSEFVAAGIQGPISPTRLHFRAEDGRLNLGGIHFSYALTFCATSLTPATMSTTFATNLASGTTTSFGQNFATADTGASIGSTPNNNCLTITDDPFALNSYDPTGPRPNLLIDVQMTMYSWPAPGETVLPMQDTANSLHGRGLVGNDTYATAGTFANPLAVSLEYRPLPGTTVPPMDPLSRPARNERFGAAGGGDPASFYQSFVNGQAFDLGGVTMTPDNPVSPTHYTVTRNAFPFNNTQLNATPDSTADDAVVTRPLGFTFRYPGGSTTSIGACTNGYLWLDGTTTGADFSPTTAEFLGQTGNLPARLAPFWYDFHCGRNTAITNSGLHVHTDTSGGPGNAVCYVTWYHVGVFGSSATSGTCVYDMQCALREATGVVEFRYLTMPRYCANTGTQTDIVPGLVGFSRGFHNGVPSLDPRTRDLSIEMPFTTGADTMGNIDLTCVTGSPSSSTPYGGRLWAGQQARWRVDGLPPTALIGVQLLSLEMTQPGLQIPTITAPGCMLSTGTNVVLWEVNLLPGASVTSSASLTIPAGVEGARLTAQYVVLGGLFGAPDLVTMNSPALLQTVGRE